MGFRQRPTRARCKRDAVTPKNAHMARLRVSYLDFPPSAHASRAPAIILSESEQRPTDARSAQSARYAFPNLPNWAALPKSRHIPLFYLLRAPGATTTRRDRRAYFGGVVAAPVSPPADLRRHSSRNIRLVAQEYGLLPNYRPGGRSELRARVRGVGVI